jgi:hypothetical protein
LCAQSEGPKHHRATLTSASKILQKRVVAPENMVESATPESTMVPASPA